jgi:hypothetical protein
MIELTNFKYSFTVEFNLNNDTSDELEICCMFSSNGSKEFKPPQKKSLDLGPLL